MAGNKGLENCKGARQFLFWQLEIITGKETNGVVCQRDNGARLPPKEVWRNRNTKSDSESHSQRMWDRLSYKTLGKVHGQRDANEDDLTKLCIFRKRFLLANFEASSGGGH